MNTKSKFDTGNWSPVNGLPGQDDMINFLKHLFSSNPNVCFSREEMSNAIIEEFGIPITAATADCPNCTTGALYTRLTYLICDGINGVRRSKDTVFMKRVDSNQYQHVSGNRKSIHIPTKKSKTFLRDVGEAVVSVKLLKGCNIPPAAILKELNYKWDVDVLELAIERVFSN